MLKITHSSQIHKGMTLDKGTSLLSLYPIDTTEDLACMLVLPGGGYHHLAEHEGAHVARWFNALNMHAAVLNYQTGDFETSDLMKDVEDALQWLKSAPKSWNISQNRLGMIGFSAGGHLASITSTTSKVKPNLLLLAYPVISMEGDHAHAGSRLHLLGESPSLDQMVQFSSHTQVNEHTPPTFIWATSNDASVPIKHSLQFASSLAEHKVPFELHVFEEGRHGLGLAHSNPSCNQWLGLAQNWLERHQFVKEGYRMRPTLFIAGDSTAAIKGGGEKPMAGWGEFLQSYFGSSLDVDNHAINGRSTKSFLAEKRLDYIEKQMKPGDFLFIQFGHNDQKQEDPTRYTEPHTEYRENLLLFIETARKHGVTPVLLTSVSRRKYNDDGKLDPFAVGEYPDVVHEVAQESNTALLDIFSASQQLYNQVGRAESKQLFVHLEPLQHPNYPNGVSDNTHFSTKGAEQIAKLVITAIGQNSHLDSLQQYLHKAGVVNE